ncbi:MAG: UDP-N-acetylmuramoyl-L-alanine--D-glutamate ligase, partial [Clostridia bacterium]|nr:UDP-N-acetylmuramoyl-L-alanine--D-glutamate ligase [Clostridia bacterium]
MEVVGKSFLVYGMGASGQSAYEFLNKHGASVFLYSDKNSNNIKNINLVKKFSDVLKQKFDYVVLSPGIQIIGNKNIKKLKQNGAILISEMELGYLFCKGKFIAITGTNGKTTCVSLLNHVLSKKYKTFLCGNIGIPITSICDKTDENSIVICEVSSFMLEIVSQNFTPDIAGILNITPDHISRHKTFDNYYKIKLKITQFQRENQYFLTFNE